MMRKTSCMIIVLAGILPPATLAQKANLSGTWKLNIGQSFMAGSHPRSDYQLTKKIEQKGDTISITNISVNASFVNIRLPDSSTTMAIAIDGQQHEVKTTPSFPGMPPATVQVIASWQGCTLELREVTAGFANYGTERLFLSDQSQLIDLVAGHSNFGDSEQRLVFDRNPLPRLGKSANIGSPSGSVK